MEFRILGALEVRDDRRQVPLGAGKQRGALAILLLHANEVLATERLIDELWGERAPETARKAVHVYVVRLRKGLGSKRIETRPPGYCLKLLPDELDAHRFERLLQKGRELRASGDPEAAAATLRTGLALWRGPPLADFTYEPFAQTEIARLEELRLSALEERIEADLALGLGADLVGELDALVAGRPFRERLRGQLMLALYRAGRQAEALAAYQDTRRVLVEELGIEPSPTLQRLEGAILRQEPALEVPVAAEPDVAPAEPVPAYEVRKTVTVASFGLAEPTGDRDPEAVRRLRRSLATSVARAVARHGGTMAGGEGRESLVAVFGIPTLHEDDALRTVRAALELGRQELPLRAGIESGEVVVAGGEVGAELLATEVAESAARLRDVAGTGEIVLGEAARKRVSEAVRVEPSASGWRVVELVPEGPFVLDRLDAPFVGREDELAQLRDILARAVNERTVHLVTVLGVAGIGKSRLLREFAALIGGEVTVLMGRCLSYGEGITFWPLRELVEQAAGELTRERVLEVVASEHDAAQVADRLAAALGLADPDWTSEEEIFWAARRLFETLAHERPLVVGVEDMHWAEPTFLDLVEHLAEWMRDAPLLLVCLARPELLEERPVWGGGKPNAASLMLEPLGPEESQTLIERLPAGAQLSDPARARIAEVAEGNPLFLEQLLAMAAEGEDLGGELSVPPTVEALLAARLDRLGPGERAVLERASVVGKEFWTDALAELLPAEARPSAFRHLAALVRKQLLRPVREPEGREAFRFGHVLIRQAAYRSVPKGLRAELHERFASWLVATAGERIGELEEIVGYHFEQAFRYLEELGAVDDRAELAGEAAARLGAAGRRALARYDMPAAANLLDRTVVLVQVGDPARPDLLRALGAALHGAGVYARAERVLDEAIAEAAVTGERGVELLSRLERCSVRLWRDPGLAYEEAERLAANAVPAFAELGDEAGLARALILGGEVRLFRGSAGSAFQALETGLQHARHAGDRRLEAEAVMWLAMAAAMGPMPVAEATRRLEAIRGTADHPVAETAVLVLGGLLEAMEGRFDAARARVDRARAVGAELSIHTSSGAAVWLGHIELLAGEPEAAEMALRPLYESLSAKDETGQLSSVAAWLAEAVLEQGRDEEARRLTREAEKKAQKDDVFTQVGWRCDRARLLAREGATTDAERLAREAVSLAEATDYLGMQGDALMALAEALARAGRRSDAVSALGEAARLYERKGNVVSARRARAAHAELVRSIV
jgi:DNA-binding SARP family transcriptional activator/tetratricopeptide (TPR) repeat protein